jgi:hypothetical protein
MLLQPLPHLLLALIFDCGVALHSLHSEHEREGTGPEYSAGTRPLLRKIARLAAKTTRSSSRSAAGAGGASYSETRSPTCCETCACTRVICRGHFAYGAEKFTPDTLQGETKPRSYLQTIVSCRPRCRNSTTCRSPSTS